MKNKIALTLILILTFTYSAAVSVERLHIVIDSNTNYRILLGAGASPVEEFAAQELQGYVMQVTNVFLPMADRKSPATGRLMLVGREPAERAGLDLDSFHLKPDGFIIKTLGDMVILTGGSSRGTLYSVYAFLEILGCRWLAPGILGEVIPRRANLAIEPIDHRENPDISHRGFTNIIPVSYEEANWIDWMAKNRMNYIMIPRSNYSDFREILGGEIERRGIDTGVIFEDQSALGQIGDFISSKPEVDIVPFYAELPDEILSAASDQFPEKFVIIIQPGQNASGDEITERCYRHSLGDEQCEINFRAREQIKDLSGSWDRIHIHEYYMGSYSQNSLPFPVLHTIAQDIKYFSKMDGIEGVISQCEPGNWGAYGMNYYVFARMSWNSETDIGYMVDDYCEKFYGPASEPIKRYYAILEDAMAAKEHFQYSDPPGLILYLLDGESVAKLEASIKEAKRLASDAMVFDRLRKVELSLKHAELLWNMLNYYSSGVQLQKAGESEKAEEHFQQSIRLGEELVSFLFQNIDEDVYIIPESYIFDYLEPFIMDAREQKDALESN